MNNDSKAIYTAISIDLRHSRIRIFKSTLQTLGKPKYIQLLVSPNQKAVAIKGIDNEIPDSHKTDRLGNKCDIVEIYSLSFVTELCKVAGGLDSHYTYRLVGKINPAEQVVFFPLSTISKLEN